MDYRKLNNLTKKDAYPLPRIEETFALLSGSKWFTVLDLKSGYYQLEVDPSDRQKTAFTTPFGNWQFRRMPQGLTNSPATFQRTMEKVMAGINLQEVIAFLDDLIIFSDTLEEHENRLLKVLKRIDEFGLKLSPTKCKFFQTSVKYLGHVISDNGIQPDPDKISAIKQWPRPNTVKELRSFLGFSGYYRRFVENYAKVVRPLNDLLKGEFATRSKSSTYQQRTRSQQLGNRWTSECQATFENIIERLTSAPVLGFADWKLPYILHTDASTTGLGAALYQVQEGKTRVVAYASRGLTKSEKNYPAHKLEFLALKWAVSEKFHDYLYGSHFKVLTDNNPLTYVLTSARLDATGHRWLAALSMYDFDIHYKSGKENVDADGLSRIPHGPQEEDEESEMLDSKITSLLDRATHSPEQFRFLDADILKTICLRHNAIGQQNTAVSEEEQEMSGLEISAVETLLCDEDAIPWGLEDPEPWPGRPVLPSMSQYEWRQLQRQDVNLARMIAFMEMGVESDSIDRKQESLEVRLLLKERPKLKLINEVLYRQTFNHRGEKFNQLVIPSSHRERALEGVHDETGHMGYDRTVELARARFYWPKMSRAVDRKCKTCERCIRRKACAQRASELVNIKVHAPLELVCIDFLTIEPDAKDTRNILVITDHFTKYAQAFPTRDQTAKTVATVLWENFICHYGFPRRFHSDQGANFESELVKELCTISGVKSHTTPYHPRGNPVERFNRTLLDLLGTLSDQKKENWRKFVKPLVHAYNCTRSDATGESPFLLMFGRQPRLPIDLCFGISPEGHHPKTSSQYVRDLKRKLKYAYGLASEHAEKRQLQNKRRWDAKVTAATIEVGDRVLVRNVNIRGKHKIADKWESAVHVVVKQPNEDLPVYVVKPEEGEGKERVLHRDLLLPCGFLPVSLSNEEVSETVNRPVTRSSGQNPQEEELEWTYDSSGELGEDLQASSLDPTAQEFTLDGLTLNSCPRQSFSEIPEVSDDTDTHSEFIQAEDADLQPVPRVPVVSPTSDDLPAHTGRAKRETRLPTYLAEYDVGYRASCRQQSLLPSCHIVAMIASLQEQLALLGHMVQST